MYYSLCGVVSQFRYRMYSSRHLQPRKISCHCTIIAFFGKSGSHSLSKLRRHAEGAIWSSSSRDSYEGAGTYAWLVAWIGSWHWTKSQRMSWTPNLSARSNTGNTYTLEMIELAMFMLSYQFCKTFQRPFVFGVIDTHPMVGNSAIAYNCCTSHHSASNNNLCPVWFTRNSFVKQWASHYWGNLKI